MALSLFGGRRSNIFDPFSLEVFDPFENLLENTSTQRETTAIATTRVDWKETDESHIFTVDLPGLKKEEVKVEVENTNILRLSGERSREQEYQNDTWHRVERSSGKFTRKFRLPENANMDQIKANMEHGVLKIVVPKKESTKAQVKSIEIGG